MATSFSRDADWASRMLATFEHAMSSTKPTDAHRMSSTARLLATSDCCSGSTVTPQPSFVSGYAMASRLAMVSSSAWACSSVVPAFRRPTTFAKWRPRPPGTSCGSRGSGLQISMSADANSNDAGMTPTIVWLTPCRRMVLPTAATSPPKYSCQNRWFRITIGFVASRASSGPNERPSAGVTLST